MLILHICCLVYINTTRPIFWPVHLNGMYNPLTPCTFYCTGVCVLYCTRLLLGRLGALVVGRGHEGHLGDDRVVDLAAHLHLQGGASLGEVLVHVAAQARQAGRQTTDALQYRMLRPSKTRAT